MPRPFVTASRLAIVTATLAGGLLSAVPAASDSKDSTPPVAPARSDQLRFTVAHSGDRASDGTYRLDCNPTAGSHPHAGAACDVLTAVSYRGRPPFAPVPADANCVRMYGGPAVAHVVGFWHGREVDATFRRIDACEIERWDALVPALPNTAW